MARRIFAVCLKRRYRLKTARKFAWSTSRPHRILLPGASESLVRDFSQISLPVDFPY